MNVFTALQQSAVATWVREAPTIWAFATVLTLHTFGLGLLVGPSAFIDLRLLGVGRTMALRPLRLLFRIMYVGFWLSLVTGSLLFATAAEQRGTQWMFFVKLLCVALGVTTMVLIRKRLYAQASAEWTIDRGTRYLAGLSLAAWIAATTAGRLVAYIQ